MSNEFDPYYTWLGISPKDQPPNHYRLLGIDLFEGNLEVIESAAERQSTYLHEVSTGPHVKQSQQLLNEIASARLCLLSDQQKAAYDTDLQAKIDATVAVDQLPDLGALPDDLPWDESGVLSSDAPSDTLGAASGNTMIASQAPQMMMGAQKTQKPAGVPILWVAIGAGGLLVLVILLLVVILIISSADNPTINEKENKDPDSPSTSKNDVKVSDGDVKKRVLPAEKIETAPPNPVKSSTSDSSPKPIKPKPAAEKKPPTNVTKNKSPTKDKPTKNKPTKISPPTKTKAVGFEPLKPVAVSSNSDLSMEVLPDDSVSVKEMANTDEVYTIQVKTGAQAITALRLEALPFKDQVEKGPGHGRGGDFTIKDFAVTPAPFGSQIPLAGAFSNDQENAHLMLMPGLFWAAKGKRTAVTVTFQSATDPKVGALDVCITQHKRENLGRLRISATTNPEWLGVRLPLAVNLGGPAFKIRNLHWVPSEPYAKDSMFGHVGGKVETVKAGSGNAVDTSCISGIQAFRAALPKGKYVVELEFCQRWNKKRDGTFSITVEGKQTKPKINVYELAGDFNKPYVETFKNVDVNDGVLDVDFKRGTDDPILNGIVIQNVWLAN